MENTVPQEMSPQPSSNEGIPALHLFPSEKAMKTYYLQMTVIMNKNVHLAQASEYERIKFLHKKLKQFVNVLQLYTRHEWGKSVAEIQDACSVYMLQKDIDRKLLLQNSREIGQHLLFITQLAGNGFLLKQMQGAIVCHYQNVEYLLKKMKESAEANKQESAELAK